MQVCHCIIRDAKRGTAVRIFGIGGYVYLVQLLCSVPIVIVRFSVDRDPSGYP